MKNYKSILVQYCCIIILSLIFNSLKANVATDYFFRTHLGSYSTIDSMPGVHNLAYDGTLMTPLTVGSLDDGGFGNLPIGFNFNYDGITRDSFCMSVNGFILFDFNLLALGGIAAPIPTNTIAGIGVDLYALTSGRMMYKTDGIAPNRVLTVEWKDVPFFTVGGNATFQIKLYETSNRIEIIYGDCYSAINRNVKVGLSGNNLIDPYNIHLRTNISNWNSTFRGAPAAYMSINLVNRPSPGLTYIWDYDSTNVNYTISGNLFADLNNNCSKDSGEVGISARLVQILPFGYQTYTDVNGDYSFILDSIGDYDILPVITDTTVEITCLGFDTIHVHVDSFVNNINFPLHPTYNCYSINVNSNFSTLPVRCLHNQVDIEYSNTGFYIANDVEVKVIFDPELIVLSSLPPWTRIDSNVYVYNVGDLTPFAHGSIRITDSVNCTALIGQTACINTTINASNNCAIIDSSWDSSSVSITGRCDSSGSTDSIIYTIMNKTMHDMTDSSSYRLYEDDLLILNSRFILNANEDYVLSIPANGKTYRLEADQVAHHPGRSMPRYFAELCGPTPYSLGYITPYPLDDLDSWVDENCAQILALRPYDPNLKSSSPAGIGAMHKVARDIPLEYTIQFQNTGMGPASAVVVIDTIDTSKLQINTLSMQLSSHAYRLDVEDGRILRWTFDPIYLAPSALDEEASHGFVKFTMLPVSGLADLTRINNYADIYFEDLPPVRTNTHFVTIADEPYTLPLPIIVNESSLNNKCFNQSIATANLNVLRGTGHYSVSWEDGNTSASRTNLSAGTYRYTVRDWYGFEVSDSIIITTPTNFTIIDSIQHVICNATNNGAINIAVSGATPAYTYRWNDGNTNQNRNSLAAGNYKVIITDANNCKDSMNFTLTEPDSFSVTDTIQHLKCYDQNIGSISLQVNGATPSYSYLWNDGNTTKDRNLLAAGTYVLTITDANYCNTTKTFTIVQPTDFTISELIENVKCYGEANASIDIHVSGATPSYSYEWNDVSGVEDRAGIVAGPYTVTITDANACQKIINYTITQPDPLVINESHTDVSAYGSNDGSINLNITGGVFPYQYSWNTGDTIEDLSALVANTYTISIVDANGCTSVETITISQPNGINSQLWSKSIQVFPNPSADYLQITSEQIQLSKITLVDKQGNIVYDSEVVNTNSHTIPIKQFSNGTYTLSISHKNKTIDYKIVVQH